MESVSEATGLEEVDSLWVANTSVLLKLCESLPGTKEGFVVRYLDGTRLKFKGAKYCELHRIQSKFSPVHVWEKCKDGVDWKSDLPEEFHDDYDKWSSEFYEKFGEELRKLWELKEWVKEWTDKQIGKSDELTPQQKQLLFMSKKWNPRECSKLRNVLFKAFKPEA